MKCNSEILNTSTKYQCNYNLQPIKTVGIQENKYYVNGKYWGEIIKKTHGFFKVKCNNGNKYMKDQIITVNFNINNIKQN